MQEQHLEKLAQDLNEYDDFWNEKILKDEFYNENSEYFVICEDEIVCGFAGLWFNIDEAHIMNIAVRKDFRKNRQGVWFNTKSHNKLSRFSKTNL